MYKSMEPSTTPWQPPRRTPIAARCGVWRAIGGSRNQRVRATVRLGVRWLKGATFGSGFGCSRGNDWAWVWRYKGRRMGLGLGFEAAMTWSSFEGQRKLGFGTCWAVRCLEAQWAPNGIVEAAATWLGFNVGWVGFGRPNLEWRRDRGSRVWGGDVARWDEARPRGTIARVVRQGG